MFAFLLMNGSGANPQDVDVIIVLAGGVSGVGVPHEPVMRRLLKAAELDRLQAARRRAPAIVCNGGGTTHKPKWVDKAGYAIPEAALMGQQLETLGVEARHIYVEGYSDDTIGNAYFLRVMHIDLRPDWTRLVVITSQFQMERTRAIFDWAFRLAPLPAGVGKYELRYEAVDDHGAMGIG